MADSIREQIVQALLTRLAAITANNGYHYNVRTASVLRANARVTRVMEDTLPAIVLTDGAEVAERHYTAMMISMSVQCVLHFQPATVNESVAGNRALADLIEAMTNGDTTLGGLAEGIAYDNGDIQFPETGGDVMSAACAFRIRYLLTKGDPYSQP
jgi:hypothetical protein